MVALRILERVGLGVLAGCGVSLPLMPVLVWRGFGTMPLVLGCLALGVLGGFLWVTIFIWGGYLFGNVPLIKENFGIVTILIIVISVMPVVWELIRGGQKPAGA